MRGFIDARRYGRRSIGSGRFDHVGQVWGVRLVGAGSHGGRPLVGLCRVCIIAADAVHCLKQTEDIQITPSRKTARWSSGITCSKIVDVMRCDVRCAEY